MLRSTITTTLVLWVALAACGDDEGTSDPTDASTSDASSPTLPAPPPFDGSFAELLPEDTCTLLVAAECDGAEDCAEGRVCCGTYDTALFTYVSIECSDTCGEANQRPLCHPGDTCEDAARECRPSQLLPFDFLAVCTMPFGTATAAGGEAIEGEIVCGDERCAAGTERCCLRAQAGMGLAGTALTPHCIAADMPCECDEPAGASPDASTGDASIMDASTAGGDEDAGDEDAGD